MERHNQPLATRRTYLKRQGAYTGFALLILLLSLALGVLGYHSFEGLGWIDSLLNASMILGGMGPVNELHTTAGKVFASFYALYSGAIFLVAVGIMMTPTVHRGLHWLQTEAQAAREAARKAPGAVSEPPVRG